MPEWIAIQRRKKKQQMEKKNALGRTRSEWKGPERGGHDDSYTKPRTHFWNQTQSSSDWLCGWIITTTHRSDSCIYERERERRVFLLVRDERIAPATITARLKTEGPTPRGKMATISRPISYNPVPAECFRFESATSWWCALREREREIGDKRKEKKDEWKLGNK